MTTFDLDTPAFHRTWADTEYHRTICDEQMIWKVWSAFWDELRDPLWRQFGNQLMPVGNPLWWR